MNDKLEWLAQNADKLQTLIDHFQIRETIEAYVHACDRCDRDAVAATYHEDSFDYHGEISNPGHVYASVVVDALKTKWESCTHHLGQSRIKVTGDSAGAETVFYATQLRKEDGVTMLDQQVGRYIDTLERRDGIWRFRLRRCTMEWGNSAPLGDSFVDVGAYLQPHRSPADASYEILGLSEGSSFIER
jgi:hypothetical protein